MIVRNQKLHVQGCRSIRKKIRQTQRYSLQGKCWSPGSWDTIANARRWSLSNKQLECVRVVTCFPSSSGCDGVVIEDGDTALPSDVVGDSLLTLLDSCRRRGLFRLGDSRPCHSPSLVHLAYRAQMGHSSSSVAFLRGLAVARFPARIQML